MYNFDDLNYLMARLRHPDTGCPWDLKQTLKSVLPYTLEEVYEVVDAIEKNDMSNLSEELGDLLFQVVFYARIAEESQYFDLHNVVDGIVRKLIRRHPHVFPNGELTSQRGKDQWPTEIEIKESWQRIKAEEKALRGAKTIPDGLLDAVSAAQPALSHAFELQSKAALVGFDWQEPAPVIEKIREELFEVEEALASGNSEAVLKEVGDVLFAAVNLARLCNVDAEEALRSTNQKFQNRFKYIEKQLTAQGSDIRSANLDTMNRLWNDAKSHV